MSPPQNNIKVSGPQAGRMPKAKLSTVVLTIGHSTRPLDEFIRLFQAHGVTRVVDVRTVPRSRHNPQFNKASLPRLIKESRFGICSPAGARRPASCEARFAQPGLAQRLLSRLCGLHANARICAEPRRIDPPWRTKDRIVLMCAEAVPWRCHRSLIADALLVRGIRTEDIMSPTRRQVHTLTPFAKVRGTTITYPAGTSPSTPKKSLSKRPRSSSSEKSVKPKQPLPFHES